MAFRRYFVTVKMEDKGVAIEKPMCFVEGGGNLSDFSPNDKEAIALFERAIDFEAHGSMSDAVQLYRRAFRLNEQVDLLYRSNKVPQNMKKLEAESGKNVMKRVDERKVRSINVHELLQSFENATITAPKKPEGSPEADIDQDKLANQVSEMGLESLLLSAVEEVSRLVYLPEDIWFSIFEILLLTNPESWFNYSITCKRNAYLGLSSSNVWRKLCYLIYPEQSYIENKLFLSLSRNSNRIRTESEEEEEEEEEQSAENEENSDDFSEKDEDEVLGLDDLPVPLDQIKLLPHYNNSWKHMLNNRPFIKFQGCYISVINYYSEGGKAEFSNSWSNPVRMITYYRYLRFYPDGTCIKVLSSINPKGVINQFLRNNSNKAILLHGSDGALKPGGFAPKSAHAIYSGTWTISTTGEVHIKIEEGSVPYYNFHYHFQVASIGDVMKHAKLKWIRYYAIRKRMEDNDDREGEILNFPLKNEKPFKFLRVRSYNTEL